MDVYVCMPLMTLIYVTVELLAHAVVAMTSPFSVNSRKPSTCLLAVKTYMAGEGEDRFDGLLLRLAGEHTEGGITEVSCSMTRRR